MTFDELQANIGKYLQLEDRFIVKMLCAAVIANRCRQLDPTWLFIVSSSSGGKSELLKAMANAKGCTEKDDLTAKTFISGARSGEGMETSLLLRMGDDPIMVIKDLTVLLTKDEREADAIFSQLRMIYDGSFNKSFGTGHDIDVPKVRMGLIAGVTGEIEDHQSKEAAVGQRAIKYYMKQPPDEVIDGITFDILGGKEDKAMREMIGKSFKEFLDGNQWDLVSLPDLEEGIKRDISALSNMATKARSSIKRKKYSRDNPIERKNPREMPWRFAKQLKNLAIALMVMNKGPLTAQDKAMLYKIALDSIPASRKEVMELATKAGLGVTVEGLAGEMSIDNDSVKIHVHDLVALGLMTSKRGMNNKFVYQLKECYRQLMVKFENIEATETVLEAADDTPPPTDPAPEAALEKSWEEMGVVI